MPQKDKSSSFLTQAVILATAGLLAKIIGFLYRLPLTNMLGDEGMGIYGAGYNIYNFFLILSSAGLPAAISKMVSSRIALKDYKNAHKVFRVSMVFAGVAGLLSALLLYFGAYFLSILIKSPESYYSIVTLAPTVFIVAILSVFRGYFQGMNNTVPTALSQVVEQIFNAVFSIYLVGKFYQIDLAYAAAGGTAATGIGALSGLILIAAIYAIASGPIKKRMKKEKYQSLPEEHADITRELVFTAFPIIAGTAVYSMTSLIDTSMVIGRLTANELFTMKEARELLGQLTGKYVTLTNLPVAISASMATAVIPSIAASVTLKDHKAASEKINLAIKLAMIISIPAAFGIGVLAEQILQFLFPNVPEGANLLKIGSVSIIFFALSQISTGVLQGIGKLKIPVFAALAGCLIKIPVNYFLIAIPSLNIIGAIIGTTLCYITASSINTYYAYKYTGSRVNMKEIFIKPVLCSVIMSMFCYIFYYTIMFIYPSNSIALLFSIGIGALVYFFSMVLVGGISQDELNHVPFGSKIAKFIHWLGIS